MTMKTKITISLLAFACASLGVSGTNAPPVPLFPFYPPIRDADPQVRSNRTLRVPTKLIVRRTHERIEVSADMKSLQSIDLKVGDKMVTGFKYHGSIVSSGRTNEWGHGLGGPDIGTHYLPPHPNEKYVIEVSVTVFETDIPPQHMWSPESGKYKELWTRTLKSDGS